MSEENKNGGIKGFFKKVKDSLEKFDKKMTETMDNDHSIAPPCPEENKEEPTVELKEEDCEEIKEDK